MVNSLPKGWCSEKLSTIAERITKGATPTSYGYKYQTSGIRFIKIENIKGGKVNHSSIRDFISIEANNNQRRSMLEDGDILFSIAGTIGVGCIIQKQDLPANTNQALSIIRGTKGFFVSGFLLNQLSSCFSQDQINRKSRGGGMNNISLRDVGEVVLSIPPLNEQRRIVDKLEKLLAKVDACKERLEKIPAILKRLRQSVLAAACSGRLTADWRALNNFDANWKTVKLSEVAHSRLGKMLDKSKNQGTPTPYLRNINVRWFSFDLKDIQTIKVTKKEVEELSIQPGDILVCEGGEPGRCAIWKNKPGAIVYQKALHRIRVGSALLPEWVCYSLKAAADSGELVNLFTGTTIKHLTGISLRELQLDLPPIEEQHEIVRRVEALFTIADDIEKRYQKARAHVDKLTQSILAKAFRGELVPQDPNDEPAAQLLKRIQAERKNQEEEIHPGRKSTRRRMRN